MQLLKSIFFLYITALSYWPCADTHTAERTADFTVIQLVDDLHEHGHCSPFCACGCCGVVLGLSHERVPTSSPVHFPLDPEKKRTIDIRAIPYSFLNAIWQPPKKTC